MSRNLYNNPLSTPSVSEPVKLVETDTEIAHRDENQSNELLAWVYLMMQKVVKSFDVIAK